MSDHVEFGDLIAVVKKSSILWVITPSSGSKKKPCKIHHEAGSKQKTNWIHTISLLFQLGVLKILVLIGDLPLGIGNFILNSSVILLRYIAKYFFFA
jgi:hypothetical protein